MFSSPDSGPLLLFPRETRGRCWDRSFLAKFLLFMCVLSTDSDLRPPPSTHLLSYPPPLPSSGPGRTAYNLHVTEDAYFPIYCVSEERGARCRGSSCCWMRCRHCSRSSGPILLPFSQKILKSLKSSAYC